MFLLTEYQPSSEGGTRSPPGGPKMVDGVWKGVNPLVFGRSKQLLLNKFFDPSTPSMRKGRNGGKQWEKTGENGRKQERVALQEQNEAILLQASDNQYHIASNK